jgi:hypothetical protein
MNVHTTVQIANHLQVSPNQIKEIREWAKVYWVSVQGQRPTFVSKKVAMTNHDRIENYLIEQGTEASLARKAAWFLINGAQGGDSWTEVNRKFVPRHHAFLQPIFEDEKAKAKAAEEAHEKEVGQVEAIAHEINDALPISVDVPWNKLLSAAADIREGTTTFDEVIKRFTSKKIIKVGK